MRNGNSKNLKKSFTLLELLIAMAVFSVLILVLMRFFSSAQKMTQRSSEQIVVYSDVREVFSAFYSDIACKVQGKRKGYADEPVFEEKRVCFWSRSTYCDKPGELVFVKYIYDQERGELSYQHGDEESEVLVANLAAFAFDIDPENNTRPGYIQMKLEIGEKLEVEAPEVAPEFDDNEKEEDSLEEESIEEEVLINTKARAFSRMFFLRWRN